MVDAQGNEFAWIVTRFGDATCALDNTEGGFFYLHRDEIHAGGAIWDSALNSTPAATASPGDLVKISNGQQEYCIRFEVKVTYSAWGGTFGNITIPYDCYTNAPLGHGPYSAGQTVPHTELLNSNDTSNLDLTGFTLQNQGTNLAVFTDCGGCFGGATNPCTSSYNAMVQSGDETWNNSTQSGNNDGVIGWSFPSTGNNQPACTPYVELTNSNNITTSYTPTGTAPYTSITASNLAPGTYTWELKWNAAQQSCTQTACGDNGTVTIRPAVNTSCNITIAANPVINSCSSSTVSADVLVSAPQGTSLTYMDVIWKDGAGNLLQGTTEPASTTNVSYTSTIEQDIYLTINLAGNTTCLYTNPVFQHTFTGIQFTSITATGTSTGETVAGANDGTANVVATGLTSGLTYSWSNGMTGSSISGLAPGTYTCTVQGTGSNAACSTQVTVTVANAVVYPSPDGIEVCLNLNTNTFEFTDKNDYSVGASVFAPCTIAITIKHSNGTISYPGSLISPDIFIDSYDPILRTYDEPNKLGMNFSIPIPMSASNTYIDDIYEIIMDWNFTSGSNIDYTKTVYLNASDIDLFGNINIDSSLQYDCEGEIESNDNTNYNVSSIPFTFTRIHELFPPASSGLANPVVSTGAQFTSYDLYEGEWSNMITTEIIWEIPATPSHTVVYTAACVKRTMSGTASTNVVCSIDPCGINQHIKKLKNRYDDASCKRDIINIKKYQDKYARAIELLTLYNLGQGTGCAEDYAELWDILGITNLDDITYENCCGDPTVNINMVSSGNPKFDAISCDTTSGGGSTGTSTGGGSGGGSG